MNNSHDCLALNEVEVFGCVATKKAGAFWSPSSKHLKGQLGPPVSNKKWSLSQAVQNENLCPDSGLLKVTLDPTLVTKMCVWDEKWSLSQAVSRTGELSYLCQYVSWIFWQETIPGWNPQKHGRNPNISGGEIISELQQKIFLALFLHVSRHHLHCFYGGPWRGAST